MNVLGLDESDERVGLKLQVRNVADTATVAVVQVQGEMLSLWDESLGRWRRFRLVPIEDEA